MEQAHGLREAIKKILEEASIDVAEERVIHYITRELHQGRKIDDILNDPYIRNRLNEQQLDLVLGNEQILKAVQEELSKAFVEWDFSFEK